ncbi:MAG: Gfo/Idh/MocA family oxidoreductase [Gemmataceae bacterium]
MTTRRTFLLSAGATALAATVQAANDIVRVGCIGTGGRCRALMRSLAKVPLTKIVAVCDVWDTSLAEGKKLADSQAFATKDYRELLAREDVDAVVIGTPDHWHVPLTVAACAAKKDVYVEKPLTHDLTEGRAVVEAQNAHKRVVQVGTQQRSMPHIQKAREIVRGGGIGTVRKVHMSWNRNADRAGRYIKEPIDPKTVDWTRFLGTAKGQPFEPYRFRQWRWFWDFGGGLFTDLMVHWIDVAHWVLDLDHPERAVSLGDHLVAKGVWETPDTVQTVLSYANGVQMHFEGTFANARGGAEIVFMGSDANLVVDRGGYVLTPEKGKPVKPEELIVGTGPRGADFYDKPDGELLHLTNWVECVRSRKTPNAPAEGGVSSASAAHLANKALREGGAAVWKG